MASNFIGINRGMLDSPPPVAVVTGAATQGTDIELRIDTGKGTTRRDVLIALESLRNFILSNGYGNFANLPPT